MATVAVAPVSRPVSALARLRLPDVDEHQIQRALLLLGATAVVLRSAGRSLAGPR